MFRILFASSNLASISAESPNVREASPKGLDTSASPEINFKSSIYIITDSQIVINMSLNINQQQEMSVYIIENFAMSML